MKLTQAKLKQLFEQNKTQLFKYKKAYQIEFCRGTSEFVVREIERLRIFKDLPYTKIGRYVAYTVKQANKLIELK